MRLNEFNANWVCVMNRWLEHYINNLLLTCSWLKYSANWNPYFGSFSTFYCLYGCTHTWTFIILILYLLNFSKMFYQDFFPQLCNIIIHVLLIFMLLPSFLPKRIEHILELNLLEKSVKRPFFCTASIL